MTLSTRTASSPLASPRVASHKSAEGNDRTVIISSGQDNSGPRGIYRCGKCRALGHTSRSCREGTVTPHVACNWRDLGMSHSAIARDLGVSRQAVVAAVRRAR